MSKKTNADSGHRKDKKMKIRVQVIVESDDGVGEMVQEIAQLERGQLRPEELGLTLTEAKGLLEGLQRTVIEQQIDEYSRQQSSCPLCGKQRLRKGAHTIVFRTIFGKIGLSMKLFEEVLPIGAEINASTIRNHTLAVAERLESELGDEQAFFIEGCERDWEEMPRPDMPLTVGIDGGYVDSCEQKGKKGGRFEVIVGKSVTAEGESKCFGLVNSYDTKPKRRVFEVLKSQGMQMNQQITFLSDGGDTVRELQLYLNPQAEHLLDWLHMSMPLTVMNQMAKGLGPEESESRAGALKQLESIKWYLWHGNVFKALRRIDHLEADLEGEVITGESLEKLRVTLQEFQTYIENNQQWIPNYGELWRAGETISTAFGESAVDQVLSKRFVKKQQMSWSRRGAHLLLQVRTRALNEELREKFDEWYPGFNAQSEDQARAA